MPASALVGLVPTTKIDIPIDAVFIAIFITLAAAHMTLFRKNLARGHKFLFNAMLFGFSMSRIVANVARLAWATRPTNVDLQIVATVFLNAGILLIYVINNIFVWRMIRSRLPSFGWHPVPRLMYKVQLYLVIPIIVMLIVIISVTTKHPTVYRLEVMRDISKFGQLYFFVLAAQPLLLLPMAMFWPTNDQEDKLGEGSWTTKGVILLTSTVLATIEAGFRTATTWEPARPASNPAWYHSRAAFYTFNFVIDVLILTLFLVGRIDKRFWIPNKASGAGSYSRTAEETKQVEAQEA